MMRRWFVGGAALLVLGGLAGGWATVHASQSAAFVRPVAETRVGEPDDDPANLKVERVKAIGAEPLPEDRGAAGLEQMLRKLGTRASLMMIVAHPDDEDGGMLTYESRGQGARVGMLTLTRGEGGQNVVTGDFNEALGLVRTRELLAADRYLGVDQMFGTEVDFGFSKTKEECFKQWTHERVLYDAVRAVRLYRPLVVASVFIGAPSDGHGQHQVSGEMAQEVFTAAADPKVFPEMGLTVWAPAKVYGRVPFARVDEHGMFDYATGKYVPARFYNYVTKVWSTETPKANVTVPEGEPSAALGGKSFVQFAREGLALQRTQIGSGVRLASAGKFDVGYTRYGSRVSGSGSGQEKGFFDGVDTSLVGIAGLAPSLRGVDGQRLRDGLGRLDETVKKAAAGFDGANPAKSAPLLRDGLGQVDALIAGVQAARGVEKRERYDVLHELRVKRVQFNDAVVMALGLEMRAKLASDSGKATTPDESAWTLVPGSSFKVQVGLKNVSGEPVDVKDCNISEHVNAASSATTLAQPFCVGSKAAGGLRTSQEWSSLRSVPADAQGVRVPYSKKTPDQPFYDVSDPRMRDAALPLPALTAWVDLSYDGVPLRVGRVVGEEVAGAYQPVTVVPGLSVSMSPAAGVVPLSETSFPLMVRVKSAAQGGAQGLVQLALPGGWRSEPSSTEFTTTKAGEDQAIAFRVTPGPLGERAYTLTALAMSRKNGKEYKEGYHAVGYPGLVRDNLYAPATYQTRGVDVKVPPGLRVAYLPGTGDAVEASLGDIGIHPSTVSVADIAAGKLAGFDALLMGVRAYAAQKDLPGVTAKLMEFANGGGVVVVQYQSGEYAAEDAPYPLSLGGGMAERVVEEDSRVELLNPAAQALSWPNRITEKDFSGWVEERGHGFMRDWDPRYEALTEVHDAGQDPQKGGLLVAKVGKGAYVYCAYALYRQLPEGVPGAFRIMANLVSLGRKP